VRGEGACLAGIERVVEVIGLGLAGAAHWRRKQGAVERWKSGRSGLRGRACGVGCGVAQN